MFSQSLEDRNKPLLSLTTELSRAIQELCGDGYNPVLKQGEQETVFLREDLDRKLNKINKMIPQGLYSPHEILPLIRTLANDVSEKYREKSLIFYDQLDSAQFKAEVQEHERLTTLTRKKLTPEEETKKNRLLHLESSLSIPFRQPITPSKFQKTFFTLWDSIQPQKSFFQKVGSALKSFFSFFFGAQRTISGPTTLPFSSGRSNTDDIHSIKVGIVKHEETKNGFIKATLEAHACDLEGMIKTIISQFKNAGALNEIPVPSPEDRLHLIEEFKKEYSSQKGAQILPLAEEEKPPLSKNYEVNHRINPYLLSAKIEAFTQCIDKCKSDQDFEALAKVRNQLLEDLKLLTVQLGYPSIQVDDKSLQRDVLTPFQKYFCRIQSEINYHPTTAVVNEQLHTIPNTNFPPELKAPAASKEGNNETERPSDPGLNKKQISELSKVGIVPKKF